MEVSSIYKFGIGELIKILLDDVEVPECADITLNWNPDTKQIEIQVYLSE